MLKMMLKRLFGNGLVLLLFSLYGVTTEHFLPEHQGHKQSLPLQKSYTPANTVLLFDIDDVISIGKKAGLPDYITLLPRIVWFYPTVVLPKSIATINEEGRKIARRVDGAANIIHVLIERLKEMGYGDLSFYEDEILDRAIKPVPIMSMIRNLKALKSQGYTLIGATNQDYKQHQIYYRKMKQNYDIDLKDIFTVVLTTRVDHEKRALHDAVLVDLLHSDHYIYVAVKDRATKPDKVYFDAAKQLVRTIAPHAQTIIFTDDRGDNIHGAGQAGLETVHFKLAGGSACKTDARDIEVTVRSWKNSMQKKYGISLKI